MSSVHRPAIGSLCMWPCAHRIDRSIDRFHTETNQWLFFFSLYISFDQNLSFLFLQDRKRVAKNNRRRRRRKRPQKNNVGLKTLNEFSIHWMWLPEVFCYYVTENLFTHTKNIKYIFNTNTNGSVKWCFSPSSFIMKKKERKKNIDLRITVITKNYKPKKTRHKINLLFF